MGTYTIATSPVSLDDFKAEYNLNFPDVNTGTSAAVDVLAFNNLVRGTSEPASTIAENADAQKLWSWYSGVGDASVKSKATAFLTKVETDNLVHEQMLTTFNTQLQAALVQGTAAGDVAIDAKNYAAIIGDELPVVSTTTGITAGALAAYNALQAMNAANRAKAKTLAEARLYGSWLARFKQLRDTNSRFTGTSGFQRIVQCLKGMMQTTAATDDTNGGESSWAVFHRVSAANKKLIKDAIVKQMGLSTSAV